MPKTRQAAFQYFVSPAGDDATGDGTRARPVKTVTKALARVLANHRGQPSPDTTLSAGETMEITGVDGVGAGSGRPARQFAYFLAPETAADHGDGSEAHPWPNLETALAHLAEIHGAGRHPGDFRPGDRLQLTRRVVFDASPVERKKHLSDQIARIVLAVVTAFLVIPLLAIVSYLLVKAWPALSWAFLFENPQNYMTAGGVWAPLVGTIYLVLISLTLATPIGVLAGVYLNEYAGDNWLTRLVNLAVVNLAGVPSIVHALFGVGAFVLFAGMGRSVLAASCTLAIMTLPVIIASTREALAAVPQSFREACWNMGASRWQTIRTIVLPNAISGILTGVILQVSRAAGETAPILFTGAVFYVGVPDHGVASVFPYGLFDRCMALSYHLFTIATQVTGVSESLQYAVAVVLFGLVLAVNMVSIVFRVFLRSRKKW